MFVNDLNVHSESWEEHFQNLDVVFLKLKEVNLKLNPSVVLLQKVLPFKAMLVMKEPN